MKHVNVRTAKEGGRPSRWLVWQRAKDYGIYDPGGTCRVTVPRSPSIDQTRTIALANRIADLMEAERW